MRIYNTLSGEVEGFKPITKQVKMFVCGPTVYNYIHLGNAKTYVQFDFIARSLRYLGFELEYLQNITDIDDRIIEQSKKSGRNWEDISKEFTRAYLEDVTALGVVSVNKYAKATDYISQIIAQVKTLIDKGFAYKISDGYYFDITKFDDYGKLSGRTTLAAEDAVSRIDENPEKRNSGDFALWKFSKQGEPSWQTELGEGRPGWHIEDTAITEAEFGPQYDIHGGARDLIFPHHEAEIAQMESASGVKPLVRYWMHTGFLTIDSQKMSKSKGNFTTIREMLSSGVSPLALRYYFLSANYRSPMNFSLEAFESAENAYRKLKETFSNLKDVSGSIIDTYKKDFTEALEEDLNSPAALAVVWNLVKASDVSDGDKRATLLDFDKVLGFDLDKNEYEVIEVPEDVQTLLKLRDTARLEKDFKKSDDLREEIRNKGFEVLDRPSGQELKKL